MSRSIVILLICTTIGLGLNASCSSSGKSDGEQVRVFTHPVPPPIITTDYERGRFLVTHYWDEFDFADTAYIHLPEILEQAFSDYIYFLSNAVDVKTAHASIGNTLLRTNEDTTGRMYEYIISLFDKYLYDTQSPFRREELFFPVVEYVLQDSTTSYAERVRYEDRFAVMSKNREGSIAADFAYVMSTDKTSSLHSIKSDYTLLLFYNPDCHTCSDMIRDIKASPVISHMIEHGQITVLLHYPGNDLSLWQGYSQDIPASWINGYDKNRHVKNNLYDFVAMPTLFLLDKDKRVLLKDVSLIMVERYLRSL